MGGRKPPPPHISVTFEAHGPLAPDDILKGELLGHQYTESWRLRLMVVNDIELSLDVSQEHPVRAFG